MISLSVKFIMPVVNNIDTHCRKNAATCWNAAFSPDVEPLHCYLYIDLQRASGCALEETLHHYIEVMVLMT